MALNVGIVGLPNVGKSSLFSSLTASRSEIANYPFCTIDPNIGIVEIPDERLSEIANFVESRKIIPAVMEFVDIAGLVKGASKGEGLGNKFLANIREVSILVHVVRCFEDKEVIHVDGDVNPQRDISTINTELCLADLDTVQKSILKNEKNVKSVDKEISKNAKVIVSMLKNLKNHLMDVRPAIAFEFDKFGYNFVKSLNLLTIKKVIYVCNVDEDSLCGNKYTDTVRDIALSEGNDYLILCAKIEAELAEIDDLSERMAMLESMGINASGLSNLIRKTYSNLGLRTYFTAGVQEVRAWTFKDGMKAPEAAGIIHSDFQRGFIKAEVYSFDDLAEFKGVQGVKEKGRLRIEGKDYLVKDGDIIFFKFNV
ncbi:redox-regulated ATPase YchF [Borrelia miyamotoi]|uniref:Ribosome-binding ATPase YchF n=1 Tax=Borrelia miyamotoi TaxID=47466 RepID=A0AAQ2WXB6_9SPIR|nr:redox-regulated ATPase YchF [Borrelia miyamotoi]AGT27227.1 GTP-binding protein YchF [Borrelia miyamotoi LB-2001]AJA58414.1 GTP-binding protein [Borrelia miyamotoi]AOW95491.1 redox-regulated ATPase YchF [Borrelia miyamotoi]QTL83379.1 redox-regulated ATPase YchF [Borrelia miyamotoi]WAZ85325.1 redox-regulated ATPase YchF [Borrelia miyamotoi]